MNDEHSPRSCAVCPKRVKMGAHKNVCTRFNMEILDANRSLKDLVCGTFKHGEDYVNFDSDLKSIQYLVHQSRSKKDAIRRFQNTHGFNMPRSQAQKAFNHALGERFSEENSLVGFFSRITHALKGKR